MHSERPNEALQTIATARDSRWLHAIIVPMIDPSTEEPAATLQDKANGILDTSSDVMVRPTADTFEPASLALVSSEDYEKVDEKANAKKNERANEPIDTDEADSLELGSSSSQSIYAPSSSEECSSDSISSSDSENEAKYQPYFEWDVEDSERGSWYCSCGKAFVDSQCPDGHCGFCRSCG